MQRFAAMRWLALAPLFAATGCNWLYGLEETLALDAAPSELPPSSRTALRWGIATTDGVLMGGIDPQIVYLPIGKEMARPQKPIVLVGDDAALMPADYAADGTFEIPFELRQAPHRIAYTLPGESIVHEVQWSLGGASLVVPRTTREDAPVPPTNSGYKITPVGVPQLVAPAIYTSGAFTFSNDSNKIVQAGGAGSEVTFNYEKDAQHLTAPAGAPQSALGDWVLLAEWGGTAPTYSVTGYAKTEIDLVANMMSSPAGEPVWQTMPVVSLGSLACGPSHNPNCLPQPVGMPPDNRLALVPGATTPTTGHIAFGVSPSTDLPGFMAGIAPTFIDRPLMLPFVDAMQIVTGITLVDPSGELALERVVSVRKSTEVMVGSVKLTSSLQTITNVFTMNAIQFSAPLVTNARLGNTGLFDSNPISISAASGLQKLSFDTEATFTADDFVVTLYEITATSLAPVRVYHVLGKEVKIDMSLLALGHQYVFGISSRTGLPGAKNGDYGRAQYPFSQSTTFLRTFSVQ